MRPIPLQACAWALGGPDRCSLRVLKRPLTPHAIPRKSGVYKSSCTKIHHPFFVLTSFRRVYALSLNKQTVAEIIYSDESTVLIYYCIRLYYN